MASRPWRLKKDPNAPKIEPLSPLQQMRRRALYAMYVAQELVEGQPEPLAAESSSKAQAAVTTLRQLATAAGADEASLAEALKAVTAALAEAGLGETYATRLKREVRFCSVESLLVLGTTAVPMISSSEG